MDGNGIQRLSHNQRVELLRGKANSGKSIELETAGLSMAPLIMPSSSVRLEFAAAREIAPGDIILFDRGESLVLHRVLKVFRRDGALHFVEKGDHQPMYSIIPATCYLARLVSVRTDERVFDADSARGRFVSKLALYVSRVEKAVYVLKVRLFGTSPLPGAKTVVGMGRKIRSLLHRPATRGQ
jgi:hypothetical protein